MVSKYFVNDLACKAMKFTEIFFHDTTIYEDTNVFSMCSLKINFQILITPDYFWHYILCFFVLLSDLKIDFWYFFIGSRIGELIRIIMKKY